MVNRRKTICIGVADEHPMVRLGLRTAIQAHTDFEFVGEASSGMAAIALAQIQTLDILLIDLHTQDPDGLTVAERLADEGIETKILLFTDHCDHAYVERFLRLGLIGYLLKDESPRRVINAIHEVHRGEPALSTAVQSMIMRQRKHPKHELSERELEVLALVARGQCNQQIANALIISPGTVKNHINNVYAKLPGVHNRSEAVAWAWENRIVTAKSH